MEPGAGEPDVLEAPQAEHEAGGLAWQVTGEVGLQGHVVVEVGDDAVGVDQIRVLPVAPLDRAPAEAMVTGAGEQTGQRRGGLPAVAARTARQGHRTATTGSHTTTATPTRPATARAGRFAGSKVHRPTQGTASTASGTSCAAT